MCSFPGRVVTNILRPQIDQAIANDRALKAQAPVSEPASQSTSSYIEPASSALTINKTSTKRKRSSLRVVSNLNLPQDNMGVNIPQ